MKQITFPGLIDPHVHLRDPGETDKEDFFTGTSAALAGGYTTILDMPNNTEPVLSVKALRKKQKIAREKIVADVGFYFGSLGDNLEEFEGAVKSGARGLKLYLNETTGGYVIKPKALQAIFKAWPSYLPILVHAEEEALETTLSVLAKTPRKLHICHLSRKQELEQVIALKNAGLPLTCGVTPHHLFLTSGDEKVLGPYGKMRPPLRTNRDVQFLWKHLPVIDCIESDHAPHTRADKESDTPPNGIPGLETTVPLLLTAVAQGKLDLHEVIRLCHDGPARIFNIRQGKGTYTELDLTTSHTISNKKLHTKSAWTPFHGWKATGKIRRTYIREQKVFEDGVVLVPPGFGTIV